jgi:hypothetical protein
MHWALRRGILNNIYLTADYCVVLIRLTPNVMINIQ